MSDAQHPSSPRRCECLIGPPGPTRHGFTLLEVLLVMALMVVVSTLAGVNLRSSFRQQRLLKAAEQVRGEWTRARVEAIKTGRVQVFYHAMQGNRSLVMPQVSLDDPMFDVNSSAGPNTTQSVGLSNPVGTSWDSQFPDIRQRELPRGVMFWAADVQIDDRSAIQLNQAVDPQNFSQLDSTLAGDGVAGQQWGMPIYFFPDGTSSTAQLMLVNDRNDVVRVYLRGLTGLVRVGRVEPGGVTGEQEIVR